MLDSLNSALGTEESVANPLLEVVAFLRKEFVRSWLQKWEARSHGYLMGETIRSPPLP